MAGPYSCDNCNEEPAAVTVTTMETGETQFLGPFCYPLFCLEVAKTALPKEVLAELLGPIFVEVTAKPQGGRGGRKAAKVTSDTPGEAPPPPGASGGQPAASPEEGAAQAQG